MPINVVLVCDKCEEETPYSFVNVREVKDFFDLPEFDAWLNSENPARYLCPKCGSDYRNAKFEVVNEFNKVFFRKEE